MQKIKVIQVEKYRDGGTVVYEDSLNRRYYMWYPTKKIYNQMGVGYDIIPNDIKEIPIELEIVNSRNEF